MRVLGLDLGSGSVGWALVDLDAQGDPTGIVAAGSSVFNPGVENLGRAEEVSHQATRRLARQARRQNFRRSRRRMAVYGLLAKHGLLPDLKMASGRHAAQEAWVADAVNRWNRLCGQTNVGSRLIYHIRKSALDVAIPLEDLGRVIYLFAQRRGFRSSRCDDAKECGVVLEGISKLRAEMNASGARTLGEYLTSVPGRVRDRYVARDLYEQELDLILSTQAKFHPDVITNDFRREIMRVVFYQRRLRSQKHLIGPCALMPNRKRAPMSHPLAQRFRMLAALNDLRVGGTPLSDEQRDVLKPHLERSYTLGSAQIRNLLKISPRIKLSLEGRKLIGMPIFANCVDVLGERWEKMTPRAREEIIDAMRSIASDEIALTGRLTRAWGIPEEQARALAHVKLSDDHLAYSLAAIRRLIPRLERGENAEVAARAEFPERYAQKTPEEHLASVEKALPNLRNPVVTRGLSVLRKVVNAITARYGKPDLIRVELSRDVRKGKKQRLLDEQRNDWRNTRKIQAVRECQNLYGVSLERDGKVSGPGVDKAVLLSEQGFICPYSGMDLRRVSWGEIQIDHVVPISRGNQDGSLLNRVACHANVNQEKGNRTPMEAWGHDPVRVRRIERAIAAWPGAMRVSKGVSRRIEANDIEGSLRRKRDRILISTEEVQELAQHFRDHQMRDTQYLSREAVDYLSTLYGGVVIDGCRKVQVVHGVATAHVRSAYEMSMSAFGHREKTRDDHRHHAVDAIAIAITSPGMIQTLSLAAQHSEDIRARGGRARMFEVHTPPWPSFADDLQATIDAIVVVPYRQQRKVSGQMHQASFYAVDEGGAASLRTKVASLSRAALDRIIDPEIRAKIIEAMPAGWDASDAATKRALQVATEKLPFRRVRVAEKVKPIQVGSGRWARHVVLGNNHHFEIIEGMKNGKPTWTTSVMSMWAAYHHPGSRVTRKGKRDLRRSVICYDHGDGKRLVMAIHKGDVVEMDHDDGRALFYVLSFSETKSSAELCLKLLSDGSKRDRNSSTQPRMTISAFQKRHPQKVVLNPLGEIIKRYA